eukprot:CAMPEP_0119211600 /NCGR_PEP_ID=MMETSP1327-20130426/3050_1 /TAXON_ID=38833 /ORGANISM="Micromonas pusilla, Strain RCC2306" /LENGTH=55 /DNA_ID=CAMNT_0007208739 /DNA_START=672 /DNA_END=839 /DNA_ORIENTATION=+
MTHVELRGVERHQVVDVHVPVLEAFAGGEVEITRDFVDVQVPVNGTAFFVFFLRF